MDGCFMCRWGWGTVGGVSIRVRIGCHLTKFDSDWNTYLLVFGNSLLLLLLSLQNISVFHLVRIFNTHDLFGKNTFYWNCLFCLIVIMEMESFGICAAISYT